MSQTKAQLIDPVDGTIVNADINASAAIAGSKISPDFGSQNIVTTGGLTVDTTTLKVDASNNRVGIGTASPDTLLHAKINTFSDDINKVALTLSNNQSSGVHQYFQNASTGTGVSNGARIGLGNTDNFLIQHFEAKDIQISTNGSERMRIASSGNVGIGTTSPQRLLHQHVSSSAANYHSFTNSTTGSGAANGLLIGLTQDEHGIVWNYSDQPLRFATNNSERMRIDSSGNIGIGTTSPSAKLQVSGGHINIGSGYSYQWGNSHERIEQSDGKIEFFTNNGEQMTLSGSNLGIGLTSPTSTLHVNGDVRTTNRLGVGTAANFANIVSYVTGTGSYPPSGGLVQADNADSTAMFWNASNSANYTGLSIECRTTGAAYWMLANVYNSSFSGDLAFRTRTGGSANAERVRFRREGGITFNGDTAAANALDDYEEGTWAPAISAGGTDFTVVASGCTYTKIGNTVFFYFDILQNHSGNITEIFDLPFTVAKHGTFRIGWISNSQQGAQGSSDMAGGLISNGNSALSFRPSGGNTNINIPAGTRFIGSGFYQTS